MEEEIWKDIPSLKSADATFQASSLGRLRVIRNTGTRILGTYDSHGYRIVTVCINGKKIRHGIHRYIAEAFIPKDKSRNYINHKNGIKTDNRPENLEWVTIQENNIHRCRVLNAKCGRDKRPVVCIDTGEMFPSITKAAEAHEANLCKILACCKGQRKHHRGLSWAYAEDL